MTLTGQETRGAVVITHQVDTLGRQEADLRGQADHLVEDTREVDPMGRLDHQGHQEVGRQ